MESAFTGLVRKHIVPFKPNISIATQYTIIKVCWFFRQVLFIFSLSSVSLSLSPTLAVPAARSVLVLANATGIKE